MEKIEKVEVELINEGVRKSEVLSWDERQNGM
jgi:hypothetical protein